MKKINKYEQPYTYLKQIENRKITESFINSFLKLNIPDICPILRKKVTQCF